MKVYTVVSNYTWEGSVKYTSWRNLTREGAEETVEYFREHGHPDGLSITEGELPDDCDEVLWMLDYEKFEALRDELEGLLDPVVDFITERVEPFLRGLSAKSREGGLAEALQDRVHEMVYISCED